jgi:hypothetical protein
VNDDAGATAARPGVGAPPDPAEAANGVAAAASTASPSISTERRIMTDPLRRKLRLLRKD